MKKCIATSLLLVIIGSTSYAESSSLNLALPSAPGNYQYDKFRAGDLDCQNAIGSATTMEFGVTGIIQKGYYNDQQDYFNSGSRPGDIGVYGRIVIPLGAKPKARINCNELYILELKKKRLEVMKLEQELKRLNELSFEN
jgi:hypothetical protein